MKIEDLGIEEHLHPITKIRLTFYSGKWYVEYRRKPKYFFDRWWWFDDSIHTEYNDAQLRANILSSDKAIREYRKKIVEINLNEDSSLSNNQINEQSIEETK